MGLKKQINYIWVVEKNGKPSTVWATKKECQKYIAMGHRDRKPYKIAKYTNQTVLLEMVLELAENLHVVKKEKHTFETEFIKVVRENDKLRAKIQKLQGQAGRDNLNNVCK